jgi:hypothetical protein
VAYLLSVMSRDDRERERGKGVTTQQSVCSFKTSQCIQGTQKYCNISWFKSCRLRTNFHNTIEIWEQNQAYNVTIKIRNISRETSQIFAIRGKTELRNITNTRTIVLLRSYALCYGSECYITSEMSTNA